MRNNPRSLAHSPSSSPASRSMALVPACVRRGVLPGEGAHREIAAYLLDSGGRGGVPATAPVFLTYPDGSTKHGSLQEFVHSDCDCEEMGYSAFSVHEVCAGPCVDAAEGAACGLPVRRRSRCLGACRCTRSQC